MSSGAWSATTKDDDFLKSQLVAMADRRGLCLQPASLGADQPESPLEFVCRLSSGRELLMADLRTAERWASLDQTLAFRRRDRAESPYVIGLVDGGLPVDRCLDAQRLVDRVVCLPLSVDDLDAAVDTAMADSASKKPVAPELRELVGGGERLVARTPYMYSLFENVEMIAKRDLTVLLIGETGTGKTTLARIIHGLSARYDRSFTNVACGTLQTELIDSALFGHVRGAFAGADSSKEGKFAAAMDGTILLDEIDMLGLHQQAKLLRVLETGQYESLGSNDTLTTTARVIVASNEPLKPLMERGNFRPDLYFRLNQVMLELPPLRNRPLDIVPLALQFIELAAERNQVEIRAVHPDFLDALETYYWPGNVRELRNEVTRAVLFARNGIIDPHTLSATIKNEQSPHHSNNSPYGLAGEVACTEQAAIERMLKVHRFNRTATAKALGISRVTLYNKIRRYRIEIDALRAAESGAPLPLVLRRN